MNNEFKHILLKMANMPKKDQCWILNQLSAKQNTLFKQWQGDKLLEQARRFCTLPHPQLQPRPAKEKLPDLCNRLQQQELIYIAIILEQGQFKWEQQFLQSFSKSEELKRLGTEIISLMKPSTKASVFKHWQQELDFNDQLESLHG